MVVAFGVGELCRGAHDLLVVQRWHEHGVGECDRLVVREDGPTFLDARSADIHVGGDPLVTDVATGTPGAPHPYGSTVWVRS